jgi:thiamine-phosphate pyrophosphorylase
LRGLYAVTPECEAREQLLAQVEAALNGGCRIVQYRDKLSAPAERVRRAQALSELTRSFAACFLINDDLALAMLVDADGVHLGREDGHLVAARAILGSGKVLGASCYADFAAAEAAQRAGADYVAFGAVYPSATKPQAPTAPLELFSRAKAQLNVPCCAIGGISLAGAPALIAAGADMLAVISDLFTAPDIAGRATAYQQFF